MTLKPNPTVTAPLPAAAAPKEAKHKTKAVAKKNTAENKAAKTTTKGKFNHNPESKGLWHNNLIERLWVAWQRLANCNCTLECPEKPALESQKSPIEANHFVAKAAAATVAEDKTKGK